MLRACAASGEVLSEIREQAGQPLSGEYRVDRAFHAWLRRDIARVRLQKRYGVPLGKLTGAALECRECSAGPSMKTVQGRTALQREWKSQSPKKEKQP